MSKNYHSGILVVDGSMARIIFRLTNSKEFLLVAGEWAVLIPSFAYLQKLVREATDLEQEWKSILEQSGFAIIHNDEDALDVICKFSGDMVCVSTELWPKVLECLASEKVTLGKEDTYSFSVDSCEFSIEVSFRYGFQDVSIFGIKELSFKEYGVWLNTIKEMPDSINKEWFSPEFIQKLKTGGLDLPNIVKVSARSQENLF
jgi:hypothetical protein